MTAVEHSGEKVRPTQADINAATALWESIEFLMTDEACIEAVASWHAQRIASAKAEALAPVLAVRDHYASPTAFPPDAAVPTSSVVNRLNEALSIPSEGSL